MITDSLVKTLLKAVDVEKLQAQALADPRVQQALNLVQTISDDFAALKKGQEQIMARLDKIAPVNDYVPIDDAERLLQSHHDNLNPEKE